MCVCVRASWPNDLRPSPCSERAIVAIRLAHTSTYFINRLHLIHFHVNGLVIYFYCFDGSQPQLNQRPSPIANLYLLETLVDRRRMHRYSLSLHFQFASQFTIQPKSQKPNETNLSQINILNGRASERERKGGRERG